PYWDLFRGVRAGQAIQLSEMEAVLYRTSDEIDKWLDEALKAAAKLAQEVEAFKTFKGAGQRFLPFDDERKAKLGLVREAHASAASGIQAAVQAADVNQRQLVLGVLRQLLTRSLAVLQKEAHEEANAHWRSTVYQPFKEKAQDKYPFDEGAAAEVSLADFSAFFRPERGEFWLEHREMEKLRGFFIDEKPLVTYSRRFDNAVSRAALFRRNLFGGTEGEMSLRFNLELIKRESVEEIKFELGDGPNERFNYDENPQHRGELRWLAGSSRGAKLSIRYSNNAWTQEDHSSNPWGLLRLIRKGAPQPEAGGDQPPTWKRVRCTWKFPDLQVFGSRKTLTVEGIVEAEDAENPFRDRFFTEFVCPEKVSE
ncbi:MAG: type VI secretion IcmF C-terminal domain-containing protein, partial [Thermoanaerobaculia bacterium]